MPLAPRLAATSFDSPKKDEHTLWSRELLAYISTSRMGILFPRNNVEPGGDEAATARATYGSVSAAPVVSFDSISRATCHHSHTVIKHTIKHRCIKQVGLRFHAPLYWESEVYEEKHSREKVSAMSSREQQRTPWYQLEHDVSRCEKGHSETDAPPPLCKPSHRKSQEKR